MASDGRSSRSMSVLKIKKKYKNMFKNDDKSWPCSQREMVFLVLGSAIIILLIIN